MDSQPHTKTAKVFLLNRDHIVSVSETSEELIVTTSSGKLVISGEPEIIAKFRDGLANDVGSNFVSVPKLLLSAPTK